MFSTIMPVAKSQLLIALTNMYANFTHTVRHSAKSIHRQV